MSDGFSPSYLEEQIQIYRGLVRALEQCEDTDEAVGRIANHRASKVNLSRLILDQTSYDWQAPMPNLPPLKEGGEA